MNRQEQIFERHRTLERLTNFLQHSRPLQGNAQVSQRRSLATPRLSPSEQQHLLEEWNDTAADWPRHHCIHELVEMQAKRTPNVAAVVCGGEQLTYRELSQRSNQLAHHLQQMTSGMDVPIGICVERSLEMAIGILAILKSGAAYLPFDPSCSEQLLHLHRHTLLPVLLTQRKIASKLPRSCAELVFIESFQPDSDSVKTPPRRTTPGNLAAVIYTRGTSSTPEAVAIPHRPLVNLIAWHSTHPTFSQPARTLQFASLSSSASIQEMFSTWTTGGTLVLAPEALRGEPKKLLKFLKDEKIERLFLPSVTLQQVAEASARLSVVPTSLRDVISTGEPLRISPSIASFLAKLGNCSLHHHYGSTELQVAAAYTLAGSPCTWPLQPPIGRPIANTKIYLLDADLKPVAPGLPGEIFVSGECLAQGYLHRPHLTARRFVASPFSTSRSERLFKTGDLARFLEDGCLEYLGRVEDQIRPCGSRVRPDAIDALLSQHPAVRASITVTVDNSTSEKFLCSYVVAQKRLPSAFDLRNFLSKWLPEHMVPLQVIFLDALPLTLDGKIDRHRLPAPGELEGSVFPSIDNGTKFDGLLHRHPPVTRPRLQRPE